MLSINVLTPFMSTFVQRILRYRKLAIILSIIANTGADGNSQSVKKLRLNSGKFGYHSEKRVGLGVGCVVAKADPHRPRFQRPRAFVGKGAQCRPARTAMPCFARNAAASSQSIPGRKDTVDA